MPDLLAPTLEEQILCVKREIIMRERNYPGWVKTGRLKQHNAERQIETMIAVLATLERLRDGET